MPEGIRLLRRIASLPGTRGDEPQLLARELLACLADPDGVALECIRDRADAELDAANGRRREQQALLVAEPGDVMIDDAPPDSPEPQHPRIALQQQRRRRFAQHARRHRS